jgi:tetratricopeptide (TPR) repeat protein
MNLQFGIYLMEGLIAGGIRSAQNPETPYARRETQEGADTVQFPFETLNYRTGDVDDLGILYGALLEASGIRAVFIPLEEDFIVALSLDLSEAEARFHFNGTDKLLIIDGRAWIPLAFSDFDQGFVNAWERGVERLIQAEEAIIVDLAAAWAIYPPADLPIQELRFSFPGEEDVFTRADVSLRRYIAQELRPMVQALSLQTGQDRSGEVFNRLGLLYIRCGSTDEARAALEKAAGLNYVPAMVNLGHLARGEKDNAAAASWYRRALSLDPENAVAARGLARIEQ